MFCAYLRPLSHHAWKVILNIFRIDWNCHSWLCWHFRMLPEVGSPKDENVENRSVHSQLTSRFTLVRLHKCLLLRVKKGANIDRQNLQYKNSNSRNDCGRGSIIFGLLKYFSDYFYIITIVHVLQTKWTFIMNDRAHLLYSDAQKADTEFSTIGVYSSHHFKESTIQIQFKFQWDSTPFLCNCAITFKLETGCLDYIHLMYVQKGVKTD